jgi:hypothetical protein
VSGRFSVPPIPCGQGFNSKRQSGTACRCYGQLSRLGFPKNHACPVGPDCGCESLILILRPPPATQSPSLLRYLHALWTLSSRSNTTTHRLENVNMNSPRKHDKTPHYYVDPSVELNTGLWTLFAGATVFLALRVWIKITRRHGLWYDDHILLVTWVCCFLRQLTKCEP